MRDIDGGHLVMCTTLVLMSVGKLKFVLQLEVGFDILLSSMNDIVFKSVSFR